MTEGDWNEWEEKSALARTQFDRDYAEFLAHPVPACTKPQGKRLIFQAGNKNRGAGVSATDSLKEFFPLLSADMVKVRLERYSHEEMQRRVKTLLQCADETALAEGYIYGITHKEGREYILPFLAYHYLKRLPEHKKQPKYSGVVTDKKVPIPYSCGYCGYFDELYEKGSAQMEFIWSLAYAHMLYTGGVWVSFGVNEALYALEMGARFPKMKASKKDFALFLAAVRLAETIPPLKKCGAYKKALREVKLFPQTVEETESFINTLGILNILHPQDMYGYAEKYTSAWEQKDADEHKNDYAYPVNHWRGADGVDYRMLEKLFGKLDCYEI